MGGERIGLIGCNMVLLFFDKFLLIYWFDVLVFALVSVAPSEHLLSLLAGWPAGWLTLQCRGVGSGEGAVHLISFFGLISLFGC